MKTDELRDFMENRGRMKKCGPEIYEGGTTTVYVVGDDGKIHRTRNQDVKWIDEGGVVVAMEVDGKPLNVELKDWEETIPFAMRYRRIKREFHPITVSITLDLTIHGFRDAIVEICRGTYEFQVNFRITDGAAIATVLGLLHDQSGQYLADWLEDHVPSPFDLINGLRKK